MQAFYKIARLGHNKPLIWQAKKITNMSDTNSDIHISGLFAKLPKGCHPYISLMRLDRPIGWWLLLLPGWWTILLSAENLGVALWLMALFLIGAIAMRAAGCVINDMWDTDIDRKIARTATRPLASGDIAMWQAFATLVVLSLIGLFVLLQLPYRAWMMGVASLPFIALYPAFKRFTYWPQAMLGLTFSWGIWLGHVAVTDSWPTAEIMVMYVGCVFWVIGYDTIYAVQDMKDDEVSGVKSSALALKGRIATSVRRFYLVAIGLISTAIYAHFEGWSVALLGCFVMALHLMHQTRQIDEDDPKKALVLFKSNRNAGLLLTAGLLAMHIL